MDAGASATPADGGPPGAVRCAFWLVFRLLNAGDLPSASGWIARIERLLSDAADDSTRAWTSDVPDGVPGGLLGGSADCRG